MFSLHNNFKKNYTYTVIITARKTTTNTVGLQLGLFETNSNSDCSFNGVQPVQQSQGFSSNAVQIINSTSFQDYVFNSERFVKNWYKLDVGTYLPNNATSQKLQNIQIKQIKIIEIPPPPTFTFISSKTINCNSNPVSFAVTNVYNTPNVTYEWNAPGWFLNGNPITASFMGSSSVSLVPGNNAGNISVTPIVDGTERQSTKSCSINYTPFSTNASITGKENICYTSGTTETYTLNYLPANCTVNWSSNNPSVASIASFNNQQATLNINTAGNFKLSASITNACGQKEDYAKYIYGNVSNGLPNPIIVGSEPDPNKIYNKYDDLIIYFEDQNGSTNFNPTNFEFQLDNPSDFTLIGVYGNVAVLNVKYSSPYLNLGFVTRMKNDCGWSEWKYQSFFLQGFDPYYPYYGYRVSTASNTYSAELNILIDEEDDKTPNKSLKHKKLNEDTFESYTIEIASLQGQTVFKKDKIKNNKITVPTAKWQKGVYYMKISNSKGEVKQKSLLIQ